MVVGFDFLYRYSSLNLPFCFYCSVNTYTYVITRTQMYIQTNKQRHWTGSNEISSRPLNKYTESPPCQATPASTWNDWKIEWNIRTAFCPREGKQSFYSLSCKNQVLVFWAPSDWVFCVATSAWLTAIYMNASLSSENIILCFSAPRKKDISVTLEVILFCSTLFTYVLKAQTQSYVGIHGNNN